MLPLGKKDGEPCVTRDKERRKDYLQIVWPSLLVCVFLDLRNK